MSDTATLWTVAHRAPLSKGFFRQEHWSGLPFLPPGDLPDPGIKLASPTLASRLFTTEPPGESHFQVAIVIKNPPANAGDVRDAGLIPGSGRSSGGRNGNPLQCSCLENPMDRGAWWAMVYGVAESNTVEQLSAHTHTHILYLFTFGYAGSSLLQEGFL